MSVLLCAHVADAASGQVAAGLLAEVGISCRASRWTPILEGRGLPIVEMVAAQDESVLQCVGAESTGGLIANAARMRYVLAPGVETALRAAAAELAAILTRIGCVMPGGMTMFKLWLESGNVNPLVTRVVAMPGPIARDDVLKLELGTGWRLAGGA